MYRLYALVLCLLCFGAQAAPIITVVAAGGGNLTVQIAQSYVAADDGDADGDTVVTLASNPSSTNLVSCQLWTGDIPLTSSVTPTDTFGDSGGTSWTAGASTPVGTTIKVWEFHRTVGTGASGNTITLTPDVNVYSAAKCVVLSTTTGTPTWSVDGTPVGAVVLASTTASAGNITTNSTTNSAIIAYSFSDGCPGGTGSGYTAGHSGNDSASEYQLSAAGTYAADFGNGGCGAQNWILYGIAFEAQ